MVLNMSPESKRLPGVLLVVVGLIDKYDLVTNIFYRDLNAF